MRLMSISVAAILLTAHAGVFSCDDHDHDHDDFDLVDDVTVDITGAAGIDFEARFEDDNHFQTVSGVVPHTSDFTDQVNFFRAVVDKNDGGTGQICVEVISTRQSRQECTTDPNARLSVTVFF